jgi:hypothetical protein
MLLNYINNWDLQKVMTIKVSLTDYLQTGVSDICDRPMQSGTLARQH